MTNLTNWQDDIEALGGDFDGSLSGLCIMSLSFDFTRSGLGGGAGGGSQQVGPAALGQQQQQQSNGGAARVAARNSSPPTNLATTSNTSAANTASNGSSNSGGSGGGTSSNKNQDAMNENSLNAFKKFKSSLMLNNKNCFTSTASLSALSTSTSIANNSHSSNNNNNANSLTTAHYSSLSLGGQSRHQSSAVMNSSGPLGLGLGHHLQHFNQHHLRSSTSPARPDTPTGSSRGRLSRTPTRDDEAESLRRSSDDDEEAEEDDDEQVDDDDEDQEEEEEEVEEQDDDEDDDEQQDIKSVPSPSSSCSSRSSIRIKTSPRELGANQGNQNNNNNSNNQNQNNNESQDLRINTHAAHSNGKQRDKLPSVSPMSSAVANCATFGGGTLKDSSTYSTSVITTTAPMHFKPLHHAHHNHHAAHHHQAAAAAAAAFSPYHQFSNSSFNHDFYDRYLSHDSHQPLQTPLIGIERTSDLLSLRLPPHGPDDGDSQRFPRDWLQSAGLGGDESATMPTAATSATTADRKEGKRHANGMTKTAATTSGGHLRQSQSNELDDEDEEDRRQRQKSFQFSYKSNSNPTTTSPPPITSSSSASTTTATARATTTVATAGNSAPLPGVHGDEPIDLNVSYSHHQGSSSQPSQQQQQHHKLQRRLSQAYSCPKSNMFDESMKHFNGSHKPSAGGSSAASSSHEDQTDHHHDHHHHQLHQQFHGQESMLGPDQASRQKFQYILAAPISVATKITEDTMTYLNQGQAYEIKLENITDLSEAKKGFMCSIINIGFHERHMQQAENELWQQWSQQRPSERIFSVDMKLSYNVFGVESDGLNKYEFLWDSSKAAGVFIRINSISTEFTPRKHGGEKGIPFKLSIETFSYNSKTHDSYFISAACCQIKVFKPKGAERKIRSDRDKIFKRPPSEQVKYHQSCDHTVFHECSLNSLHPLAAGSLGYYRHSHGHFGSKQVGSATASVGRNTPASTSGGASGGGGGGSGPACQARSGHSTGARSNNKNNDDENNNGASDIPSPTHHPSVEGHFGHQLQQESANRSGAAAMTLHQQQQHPNNGPGSDSEASNSRSHHNNSVNNTSTNNNQQQPPRSHTDYSTSRLLQPYHHHHHHAYHFDNPSETSYNQPQGADDMIGFSSGSGENGGQAPSEHSSALYYSGSSNHNSNNNNGHLRSVSSLANIVHGHHGHQSSTPFSMSSYYSHSLVAPYSHSHSPPPPLPPPPPPPPAPSSGHLLHSTTAISYGNQTTTPFRASNLAISSHHQLHHNLQEARHALQLQGTSKEHQQQAHLGSSMTPYSNHLHQSEHVNNSPGNSSNDNGASGEAGTNGSTSGNGPIHGHSFVDCYGTSNEGTNHSHNHHHHNNHHHHHHQLNHHPAWSLNSSAHSTNSGCVSRGCNSESVSLPRHHSHSHGHHQHHLGQHHSQQPLHHHHHHQAHTTGNGNNNSSSISNQHHNQQQHYNEHQQDSPHKSHHSNDSPQSCYSSSRFRDNNNTMSSYSSQIPQQQDLFDELSHPMASLQPAPTGQVNGGGGDDEEHLHHHQHHQEGPTLTLKSDCAEVLAWLAANRFGLFTKTFSQFSGSDLLRLSKPELIEICGIADGIRLFNSLHNAPTIKPRKKNANSHHHNHFRTIKFAQIKRELRIKRKLK